MSMTLFYFFFFFQAEDGIRDVAVTGVQTCALPIWSYRQYACRSRHQDGQAGAVRRGRSQTFTIRRWSTPTRGGRSEEHTSELQSRLHLVCRLLLEKKKKKREHPVLSCTLHTQPDCT